MTPVRIDNLEVTPEPGDDNQGDKQHDDHYTKSTSQVEVLVDNKTVDMPVMKVKFVEEVFQHSLLSVTLAPDPESADEMTAATEAGKYLDMIGASIVVKFKSTEQYAAEGADSREFQGTVYDVGFNYQAGYVFQLTLHGMSNTFKLEQSLYTQVFKQSKRSDVANSIIQDANMNADVQTSTETEEFILCHGETRWQCLERIARSEGHWLYPDGDKVVIKSPTSGDSATLTWGKNLGSMRARISTRSNKTIVRGWDYEKKQEIVGQASSTTELSSAARAAAKCVGQEPPFKAESMVEARMTGMHSSALYNSAAKAITEGRMSRLAECQGQSNAPGLKVGFIVKIEGSGAAWNSSYFVKKVVHVIKAGSYYNTFESLPLDVAHPEWKDPNPPINDFITGIVTDTADPENLGRVKVKFPTMSTVNDELQSNWGRLNSMYAGENRGIFFMPEVGDEVLVCFERGDLTRPIIMGSFWNGKDKPGMAGVLDGVDQSNIKTIYTRTGHQLTFSDEDGKESIKIIDKSEKNLIEIDTANEKISIKCSGDIAIEADKNISLTAKKDISIDGDNVNIKAKNGLKAEGMKVDLKSSGMMNLEATGNGKLKAAMLDVDGGTMCNVKGGIINLN